MADIDLLKQKDQTACFIGERKLPQDRIPEIKSMLINDMEALISQGVVNFACGGTYGFELLAGSTVLELKKKYPHIKLIVVLPHRDEHFISADLSGQQGKELLSNADERRYADDVYKGVSREVLNLYLMEQSKYCIAYQAQKGGFAADMINRARRKGLPIVNMAEVIQRNRKEPTPNEL